MQGERHWCNYTRAAGTRQGAARVVLPARPAELGASQGRRRRDNVLPSSSSSSEPLGAASGLREPQLVSVDGRAGSAGAGSGRGAAASSATSGLRASGMTSTRARRSGLAARGGSADVRPLTGAAPTSALVAVESCSRSPAAPGAPSRSPSGGRGVSVPASWACG